ncbi:flagellar motor switch protein FliN [Enterobacteriaceae bacterium ESL0689]|nr:flagellar motor switch protein FliN [Enterobacteriaceae bacterium ESL0689]
MSDPKQPAGESDAEKESADNLWADALNEQKSAEEQKTSESTTEPKAAVAEKPDVRSDDLFKPLDTSAPPGDPQDIDLIMDIPVKMTVELGRTKMTIKDLLRLSQGSVVALDGLAGEPLDILINGYLIAQGEVVVVADKYGVRITDIITPSERMRRLSH